MKNCSQSWESGNALTRGDITTNQLLKIRTWENGDALTRGDVAIKFKCKRRTRSDKIWTKIFITVYSPDSILLSKLKTICRCLLPFSTSKFERNQNKKGP